MEDLKIMKDLNIAKNELNWLRILEKEHEVYLGCANVSAHLCKDTGTVELNDEGLEKYLFASIHDFVKHEFCDVPVNYKLSIYIGDRNHDGEIEFNDDYNDEKMTVDESDDGSAVYCNFYDVIEIEKE